MKKGLLMLLLGCSVFANAQSLKDLLYSGKLKNEAGTVIRSSDDLSTKIDTAQKVQTTDSATITEALPLGEVAANNANVQLDSSGASPIGKNETIAPNTATPEPGGNNAIIENTPEPLDNNSIFNAYVDAVTNTLKTDVLTNKKIKSGTYYAMFLYSIGTDGQVVIGDVLLTPENAYLQQQIKERFNLDAPQLAPVLSTSGTPRKVNKKYNFTLIKE